jgi:hypothetical protein
MQYWRFKDGWLGCSGWAEAHPEQLLFFGGDFGTAEAVPWLQSRCGAGVLVAHPSRMKQRRGKDGAPEQLAEEQPQVLRLVRAADSLRMTGNF